MGRRNIGEDHFAMLRHRQSCEDDIDSLSRQTVVQGFLVGVTWARAWGLVAWLMEEKSEYLGGRRIRGMEKKQECQDR